MAAPAAAPSDPANDLVLLERVFLRLGSADSDEQLQTCIGKFLTPVLLKLASPHEQVRKKVMELLIHLNKRIRCRPEVQLPIDALLQQYQDARATSFVLNFSIIYLTMGYPRLPKERQTELIPTVLQSISSRSQAHQDVILLMLMPILGTIGNKASTLKLSDRPEQTKSLLRLTKEILLLPYWAVPGNKNIGVEIPVPPGMSLASYKQVTDKGIQSADELEKTKQSIVNFLNTDAFEDKDMLLCLIIAAADSRFSVANIANVGLGKVSCAVDWSSKELCEPIYDLFLGSSLGTADQKRTPSCTRIRLKLLQYLSRATRDGIIFPQCVKIVSSSMVSTNTNPRLKKLALNFSINILSSEDSAALEVNGSLLIAELIKLTENDDERVHHPQAFTCIGQIANKIPLVYIRTNFQTIEKLFDKMPEVEPDLRIAIREALLAFANAIKNVNDNSELADGSQLISKSSVTLGDAEMVDVSKSQNSSFKKSDYLDESQKSIIIALLEKHMDNEDQMVRFVATRYASVLFPKEHIPSKYLLLLASGDSKEEIKLDALKSLYGTARNSEIEDLVQNITMSSTQVEELSSKTDSDKKDKLGPSFESMVEYVWNKISKRKESSNLKHRFVVGNHVLPFAPTTYYEILRYLRMLLNHDAGISNGVPHPSVSSPILAGHLRKFLITSDALEHFLNMVKMILTPSPDVIPFTCLVDIIGCIPQKMSPQFVDQLPFLQNNFTNSMREEIRDLAAVLYSLIKVHTSNINDIGNNIIEMIDNSKSIKSLESQCGLTAAYTNLLERSIVIHKLKSNIALNDLNVNQWKPYKEGVLYLAECLSSTQNLIVNAACKNIAILGKTYALPLENSTESDLSMFDLISDEKNATSEKNTEKSEYLNEAGGVMTKLKIVNKLFLVIKNPKFSSKIKERATATLGLINVGERFPFSRKIIEGFLKMAKETKDFEIHLQIGESLVYCVDGVNSPENRDIWSEPMPDKDGMIKDNQALLENDENLEWLLTELLNFANNPHPNSRQASCIWLLALLKNCSNRKPLQSKLSVLQDAFMEYLSENNDIVQDVASKGLSLVYQCSNENDKKELVNKLVDQLAGGKRQVAQVTQDTKIFEEGQLGKTPTGGNLSTYKELCSFASDLNQPDLIYKFMHLANHNAMWNSKKGAAFGFHSIAQQAGSQLSEHLPKIVPRLYRYRFDPTPKIQNSMSSIWHALVPETQKTVEKYQSEILNDLITNLTANQWRIRMSCCLALTDLLRGMRNLGDDISRLGELWSQIFRVMDDVHEGTRNAAENTALVLSKFCLRFTDGTPGKFGKEVMGATLPILLNTGITNTVAEVRQVSLQTVSKMVTTAGESLKPFLPQLIPALLQATGDLESSKLSYLSTMLGGRQQSQEIVDSARAQAAKSHYTTETVAKCVQYIDISTFDAMLPSVLELMKSPQLGTKVACTHLFTCITHHLGKEIMPLAGKIMFSLVNGLLDRNVAVRKHCADTLGSLVGYSKESSVDKLLQKLCTWYKERDEESVRNSIALTLQSISNKHGELLKDKSDLVMPMLFLSMHAEKTPETKTTVELYEEIWSDISPGKEQGIRMNLSQICDCLKETINSPSWSMKTQAANAIATVALEMKSGLGSQRQQLIEMLLDALKGRTWKGKEKLLSALANLCRYDADVENLPSELLQQVVDNVMKECSKPDPVYKRCSLSALGDILEVLKIDRFEQVYNTLSDTLAKDVASIGKDSDDESDSNEETIKKKEQHILLQEVAYETLGKAWPNNFETQQKYHRVFASHCSNCLPTNTRTVQVAILIALKLYVEKLIIINGDKTQLNVEKMEVDDIDKSNTDDLEFIITHVINALDYSLGISKHTRLRKEAMNIMNMLGKTLKETQVNEFSRLKQLYIKYEADLIKDAAPEIRTRLSHIKLIFQDK